MRRILAVLFISLFLSNLAYSDILDENEYYKKAGELFDNAIEEYDKGDYDKGFEYSEEAKENIKKAYEYNDAYLLKVKLEAKREIASLRMDKAAGEGAENNDLVSKSFNEAAALFEEGDKYYKTGDLSSDISVKKEAYSAGIEKFVEAGDIASKILIALAKEKEPESKKQVVEKKEKEKPVKKEKDPEILALKGDAENLIKKTKYELSYAKENVDEETYKGKVKEADIIFDNALLLFDEKKYDQCISNLNMVLDIVSSINFGLVFPRYYKVRLIPDDRDSLWKIAEFDFVYGDGSKWLILYEANKNRLKYPKNPNIILPERIIEIPSINGEKRRGVYNPNRKYPKFDPDKNYRE